MSGIKEVIRVLGFIQEYFDNNADEQEPNERKELFVDWSDTVLEVITLLKAQEPVEPVMDIDTWKCGNCGHTLEHQELLGDNVLFHEQYNCCPECGKAVKWKNDYPRSDRDCG